MEPDRYEDASNHSTTNRLSQLISAGSIFCNGRDYQLLYSSAHDSSCPGMPETTRTRSPT